MELWGVERPDNPAASWVGPAEMSLSKTLCPRRPQQLWPGHTRDRTSRSTSKSAFEARNGFTPEKSRPEIIQYVPIQLFTERCCYQSTERWTGLCLLFRSTLTLQFFQTTNSSNKQLQTWSVHPVYCCLICTCHPTPLNHAGGLMRVEDEYGRYVDSQVEVVHPSYGYLYFQSPTHSLLHPATRWISVNRWMDSWMCIWIGWSVWVSVCVPGGCRHE